MSIEDFKEGVLVPHEKLSKKILECENFRIKSTFSKIRDAKKNDENFADFTIFMGN